MPKAGEEAVRGFRARIPSGNSLPITGGEVIEDRAATIASRFMQGLCCEFVIMLRGQFLAVSGLAVNSPLAIKQRRLRLGVSRPNQEYVRPNPWQPQEDALLGTASDRELARRLGRSISSVRRRRI